MKLINMCDDVNRRLVYALPPGSTHELGIEDGVGCHGWKEAQAKAATSTVRSSQMLKLFYYIFFFLQMPR